MSNPTHTNRTRNAGKITLHKPATVRKASAALRSLTEEQRRAMITEAAYSWPNAAASNRDMSSRIGFSQKASLRPIRGGDSPP